MLLKQHSSFAADDSYIYIYLWVKTIAIPDVAIPDVAIPDVAIPDVAIPDVAIPDVPTATVVHLM